MLPPRFSSLFLSPPSKPLGYSRCSKVSTTTSTPAPPPKCTGPFLASMSFLHPKTFHSPRTRGEHKVKNHFLTFLSGKETQWWVRTTLLPAVLWKLQGENTKGLRLSSRQLLACPYWRHNRLLCHSKETRQPPSAKREAGP